MTGLFQHLLVPVDYSETDEHTALAAAHLARQLGAQLTLVHVFAPQILDPAMPEVALPPITQVTEFMESSSSQQLQRLAEKIKPVYDPVQATLLESTDNPAQAIIDYAQENAMDLIVIHGGEARSGLTRLLTSSTTEKLIQKGHCSVLILKGTEPPQSE